jgi:hypothetical protein
MVSHPLQWASSSLGTRSRTSFLVAPRWRSQGDPSSSPEHLALRHCAVSGATHHLFGESLEYTSSLSLRPDRAKQKFCVSNAGGQLARSDAYACGQVYEGMVVCSIR